jgi:hypothetical protein
VLRHEPPIRCIGEEYDSGEEGVQDVVGDPIKRVKGIFRNIVALDDFIILIALATD